MPAVPGGAGAQASSYLLLSPTIGTVEEDVKVRYVVRVQAAGGAGANAVDMRDVWAGEVCVCACVCACCAVAWEVCVCVCERAALR